MSRNDKIVRYKRNFAPNVGVIIFAIIIIYVIFNIFVYVTSDQIAEYEVQQGTIAANNVYKGLILRDEEVVNTDQAGAVNYYLKNGTKASVNDVIYSVDTVGTISEMITTASEDGTTLSSNDLSEISDKLDTFTATYNTNDYYDVYSFKNDVNSQLTQTLSNAALNNLSEQVNSAVANGTFVEKKSPITGIVFYYMDGLEGKTANNFEPGDLDPTGYTKTTLNTNTNIAAESPVYKIIKSENWNMIVPVSNELAERLSNDTYIKIRFCKDDKTANASYTLIKKDEKYYLNLAFTNSMIRYAYDRYMNIELMLDEENGLKIPNTSIVEKEFYAVPKMYFTQGNDSKEYSLLVKNTDSKSDVTLVTPTIYYETEDTCYIDNESVSNGDVIIRSDSSDTYTIGDDIKSLQGVYNINKGYAVFKQVNIIYQNEEYAIAETGTSYGVALYDHIALDGKSIKENQLVTK